MTKSDRYLIPASAFHRVEDTIKRSLFITTMCHTANAEEAKAFIDSIRLEHPDATHNCWAFQAGPAGSTARIGMSDDGEPHGTAGKPMLNTLLHSNIGEIACVVTRYFGGTKLGTGGLVRAYSGMVNLGLASLPTKEKITPVTIEIVIDYAQITLFKRMLPDFEAEIHHETFAADATFTVVMPQEHASRFSENVVEMTNGEALIEIVSSA